MNEPAREDFVQRMAEMQELLARALKERDQAFALANELVVSMENDTSYPTPNVLEKLADAADILLHKMDHDGHGWELIQHAMQAARIQAPNLRTALAKHAATKTGGVR